MDIENFVKDEKKEALIEERENLKRNLKIIEERINKLKKEKEKFQADAEESRGEYTNIGYWNECQRKIKARIAEIDFLKEAINRPYEGHICLSEKEKDEDVFLGKETIYDNDNNILVHNLMDDTIFREAYYSSRTSFSHTDDYGKIYQYKLDFRRKLDIKNKELIDCFEDYNSESDDSNLNDPFLKKVLKSRKNEEGFLDIIASIQENQNEIISCNINNPIMCHGIAGSGKTVIILHRIAFLLHNQKVIKPEKFLYVVPNENFKFELNEINKALKIDKITIKTLYEYYGDSFNAFLNHEKTDKIKIKGIADDDGFLDDKIYSYEMMLEKYKIIEKIYLREIEFFENKYDLKNIDKRKSPAFIANEIQRYIVHKININRDKKERVNSALSKFDFSIYNEKIFKLKKYSTEKINLSLSEIIGNIKNKIDAKFDELNANKINNTDAQNEIKSENIEKTLRNFRNSIQNNENKIETLKLQNRFFEQKKMKFVYEKMININLKEISELEAESKKILENMEECQRILDKIKDEELLQNIKKYKILIEILEKFFNLVTLQYKNMFFDSEWKINFETRYRIILEKLLKTDFHDDYQAIEEFIDVLQAYINDINSIDYSSIDKDQEMLNKLEKVKSPRNIIDMCFKNICIGQYSIDDDLTNTCISRNDVLFILYIVNKLGFKKVNPYNYVYIDEVQDYNDIEIRFFKDIETGSVLNLFGDYRQNVSHNVTVRKNWQELMKVLGLKFKYYELNENYRNTRQIVEYCNQNLNLNMKNFGVNGNEVMIKKFQNVEEIIMCAKKNSATIITNNQVILNQIKEKSDVRVMNVKSAKGLEFKNVIVIDYNLNENEKYVAYTRSLNDLIIYSM